MSKLPLILLWIVWAAVAVGGGLFFHALGLPVSWLLGPMVACMLLRAILPAPAGLDRGGTRLGQWIIGTMMGASFSFASIRAGVPYIPVLLGLVVFTSILCLLNGWLLHRLAGVDANTGFLGSLPGAAVSSVALAENLKADPFMVVIVMHTVRWLLVLFLGPAIAIAVATWVQRSARVAGANKRCAAYPSGTAQDIDLPTP